MGFINLFRAKKYTNISIEELQEMLNHKEDYQFIDVRTEQEYKNGHIKEFEHNLNYYTFLRNQTMLDNISKDKPVVFICESGARSGGAAHMLTNRGYEEVYNVKKGYNNYSGELEK